MIIAARIAAKAEGEEILMANLVKELYAAGHCLAPRSMVECMLEGFRVGRIV